MTVNVQVTKVFIFFSVTQIDGSGAGEKMATQGTRANGAEKKVPHTRLKDEADIQVAHGCLHTDLRSPLLSETSAQMWAAAEDPHVSVLAPVLYIRRRS